MQAGGIDVICLALTTDSTTVSTVKDTCLALGRIASVNENHIDAIIASGGIQAMLGALSNANNMDAAVTAAVLSGIASLASKGSAAEQIVEAGGVEVAIRAMVCPAGPAQNHLIYPPFHLPRNVSLFFLLVLARVLLQLLLYLCYYACRYCCCSPF